MAVSTFSPLSPSTPLSQALVEAIEKGFLAQRQVGFQAHQKAEQQRERCEQLAGVYAEYAQTNFSEAADPVGLTNGLVKVIQARVIADMAFGMPPGNVLSRLQGQTGVLFHQAQQVQAQAQPSLGVLGWVGARSQPIESSAPTPGDPWSRGPLARAAPAESDRVRGNTSALSPAGVRFPIGALGSAPLGLTLACVSVLD